MSTLKTNVANMPLGESEKAELLDALDIREKVYEARTQVAAFDWTQLLKLLPIVLSFIPGLGALLPIINAILAILNVKPLPVPDPNGGGGTIPPGAGAVTEPIQELMGAIAGSPRIESSEITCREVELELENLRQMNRGGRIHRIVQVVWECCKRLERENEELKRQNETLRNGTCAEGHGP